MLSFVLNPFPTRVISEMTRISGPSPSSPRLAADRPRGTVGRVCIRTKYTNTLSPTARHHARTLGLGVAPECMV